MSAKGYRQEAVATSLAGCGMTSTFWRRQHRQVELSYYSLLNGSNVDDMPSMSSAIVPSMAHRSAGSIRDQNLLARVDSVDCAIFEFNKNNAGISNGQQQQLRAMPNTGTIFGRGVSLPPRSAVQWLLDVDLLPLPIQPVR